MNKNKFFHNILKTTLGQIRKIPSGNYEEPYIDVQPDDQPVDIMNEFEKSVYTVLMGKADTLDIMFAQLATRMVGDVIPVQYYDEIWRFVTFYYEWQQFEAMFYHLLRSRQGINATMGIDVRKGFKIVVMPSEDYFDSEEWVKCQKIGDEEDDEEDDDDDDTEDGKKHSKGENTENQNFGPMGQDCVDCQYLKFCNFMEKNYCVVYCPDE